MLKYLKAMLLIISFSSHANTYQTKTWPAFQKEMIKKSKREEIEGISYIAGGILTTIGGLVGSLHENDAAESLTYTVFQNVGIASIGLGYFRWKIGDEDRRFYQLISETTQLSPQDRQYLLERYNKIQKENQRQQRIMRAIVHGLLAGTNIVAATRENNSTVSNGLYFIGAINLFASVSFSFDF